MTLLRGLLCTCFFVGALSFGIFPQIRGGNYEKKSVECFLCTVFVNVAQQFTEIHEMSGEQALLTFCKRLPTGTQSACAAFVKLAGDDLAKLIEADLSPDRVCRHLGSCDAYPKCELFPQPTSSNKQTGPMPKVQINGWNPWKWLMAEMERVFQDRDPAQDDDDDLFSGSSATLRGYDWRGRDCNDKDPNIYPGNAIPSADPSLDWDCNGIHGINPASGKPYKEELCPGGPAEHRGIIAIGDSVTAHFHAPTRYFNASEFDAHDILANIENEMDWPQEGWATGIRSRSTETPVPLDSLYQRLWRRDHCVHRNYQNLGVNGADSTEILGLVKKGLHPGRHAPCGRGISRTCALVMPLVLTHSVALPLDPTPPPPQPGPRLLRPDVCAGRQDDMSLMTTPEAFRAGVLETFRYLDTVLAAGSTIALVPVIDGRILWDTMHAQLHPVGRGVTFADFYKYLSCLDVNPCQPWMNPNATQRDMGSFRAMELNKQYLDIMATTNFTNIELIYPGLDLKEVLDQWVAEGHDPTQIIDHIDGFHPSPFAQIRGADFYWTRTQQAAPDFWGPVNPNNARIEALFGDQGGY
ncbi:putative Acyloxyacyl hydrolase [Paratrimastix pyriformis]|uniref:Acyloxyacyl hydrolase n=1 Tax=Paratrimastix pyriformis TaxID=342808 RepID=A0ABQ8UHW9_9EUKA|nr:putative Acyloxyacyl hydrolase [Paratrimastix pyriformis]